MKAAWYFDFISPYSYLHLKMFGRISRPLEIEPVPVLFAGLLKANATKGPAEIPAKRTHTYRQCVWIAMENGIDFRFPPRHPFNPLALLRLAVARGAALDVVEKLFEIVWREGRDPDDPQTLRIAGERVGIADPVAATSDPAVKSKLLANTTAAAEAGIFGVPTFDVGGERFWGSDSIGLMNAFLADPELLRRGEMARVSALPYGTTRRD